MFEDVRIEAIGAEDTDGDTADSVRRCLSALYSTPEGTCPGDRSYGLDWSFLDYPLPVAQNMFAVEVIEKTEAYEPRAEVMGVDLRIGPDGSLSPVVTIGLMDGDVDTLYEGADDEEDGYV